MTAKTLSIVAGSCLLTLALCPSGSSADDSWLVADRHQINEGDKVRLSLATGPVFPIADGVHDPNRVRRFVDLLHDEATDLAALAAEGKGLSTMGPIKGGGIHVIGCELNPMQIVLDAASFDRYLATEQAAEATAIRKAGGFGDGLVTERYTKFAKTLLQVHPSEPDDDGFLGLLGHTLEIRPLSNPCRWRANMAVELEVLLDGHPWAGIPVSAGHEGLPPFTRVATSVTDAAGRATIQLTRPGHWFIKAHHVRPGSGLPDYDWASLWATLTFSVQGEASTEGVIRSIRAVHGRLTPWVVLGYRMGRAALTRLSLSARDERLRVTHSCPLKRPYASVADGVQAATRVTLGKLSLRLQESELTEMRTEFCDIGSTQKVTYRLRSSAVQIIEQGEPGDAEAVALRLLTLADDELFEVISGRAPPKPEAVGESPQSGAAPPRSPRTGD